MLKSVEDETAGIQLTEELPAMLANGGFRLTKLTSNAIRVLQNIPEQDRAADLKIEDGQVVGTSYTLGMKLNFGEDLFLPAFDVSLLQRVVVT